MYSDLIGSIGSVFKIIFVPNTALDFIFFILIYSVALTSGIFALLRSSILKKSVMSFGKIFKTNKISKLDISKEDLDIITNELKDDRQFGHSWNEFRESLRVIQLEDGVSIKEKYLNTLDSEHFFKSDSALTKILYTQYLDLVPGILTGLGILGTFIGIVHGLGGVDVKDLLAIGGNKSSESLDLLFEGVKTCFKTSALGITLSLLFSSLIAKIYRSAEQLFETNVVEVIDSYFKRHTEADSIYELIRLGKEMRTSLTNTLIKLSSELPEQIAKQLEPAFSAGFSSIVTSVGELKAPMENLGKNTGEKIGDGMGIVIDELVKKLGQTTTTQLDAVRMEFSALTEKMQSIVLSTTKAVESLSTKMNDADKVFSKVSEIASTIDTGQKNSQEVATKMEKVAESLSQMGLSMAHNGKNLGDNINSAKTDIENAANITKGLTEHVKNMSIEVSSLVEKLGSVISGAERTAQLSNNTVERYIQNTDKINNSLEGLSLKASLVEKSAIEISKSIVPVENTVTGLTNGLESFQGTINKLGDIGPLIASLNGLVVKVDGYTSGFTDSMTKVASSTDSFANSTKINAIELAKVSEQFKSALVEFSNIFERITPQYDEIMSDVVKKLHGSIGTLNMSMQEILALQDK